MEKVRITFTMETALKARIDKVAREQRRDFSAQLAWLAEAALKKLEDDAKPKLRGTTSNG